MDWFLEAADQVGDFRRELGGYLARHAAPGNQGTIEDAELVASEAVGNAIRHTSGPVWVSLSWTSELPLLRVHDIGPGFDTGLLRSTHDLHPEAGGDGVPRGAVPSPEGSVEEGESGRGLFIIQALAPKVEVSLRRHAGAVITIQLPVQRRRSTSIDPPRRRGGVLPAVEEAGPGGFGKESFLRALVVQLSRTVEEQHGPDAAEAAVAQVGSDVGGQMEAEFRLAEEISHRLSPEELGRCYVRLKHAIDGDFRVVEANAERIVLENTRCPFGDTVKQAPALCRMTSSVFGGIAARNSPSGASVLLEERIAVGDPGCRVVVHFGPAPVEVEPFVHHYRSPEPSGPWSGAEGAEPTRPTDAP
jgi:anti-sigma regulatory factor (Ser/Thr protein kinase)